MEGVCGTCGVRGEVHKGFWWGNVKERDHFQDLGVDGRTIENESSRNRWGGEWTELICLRIGSGIGLL
jgi:hypothetical protein